MWSSIMTLNKFSFKNISRFIDTSFGFKIVVGAAAATVIVITIVGGWYWYKKDLNDRAQRALMDSILEFEQALAGQEGISWADVERTFDTGAREFSGSHYAPYFKVFQVDAAVHQNKSDDAVIAMREAVAALSPKNELYNLYRTKLALLLRDSADTKIQTEGEALLKELADSSDNGYRDMALYYLGLYARVDDKHEEMQQYWNRLMQEFSSSDSVWAHMLSSHRDFAV